jgi:hypothetical protein
MRDRFAEKVPQTGTPQNRSTIAVALPQSVTTVPPHMHKGNADPSMTVTSSSRLRPGHLLRTVALAALLGSPLAVPAAAQGFSDRILSPDAVERALERRGFLDLDRPRLRDDVYVVTGVNPRGDRVRLVIDAFNGDVVSRDRLEEALRPPRDVGPDFGERRSRFRPDSVERRYEEYDEEDLPPGRRLGRIEIEPGELPPPPVERFAPPIERPAGIERPAASVERAAPRQPRRAEPIPPPPSSEPPKERRTAAAPTDAAKPREAAPVSVSPKPSPVKTGLAPQPATDAKTSPAPQPPADAKTSPAPQPPAEAKTASVPQPAETKTLPTPQPAAEAKTREGPARTVRVIEGVTPILPQGGAAAKPAEPATPAAPSAVAQEAPAAAPVKTD